MGEHKSDVLQGALDLMVLKTLESIRSRFFVSCSICLRPKRLGSGKGARVRLVLYQAAYPVLLGTLAGLVAAGFVVRWVRSLLFQAQALDPVAIGGSVILLLIAAAAAAIIPARRAASVEPMRALRSE